MLRVAQQNTLNVFHGTNKNELSVLVAIDMTLSFRMMAELIVLAQQILAVVVAIGRTDDDVNVIFVWLSMFAKGNPPLVVEFDDNHRALDPVVKSAVVRHAAHPTEIRIVQMILYFLHFYFSMAATHPRDMITDQIEQKVVLSAR